MLTREQRDTLLRRYPVLSGIEPDLLNPALAQARVLIIKKGTVVFDELQSCHAFPFVLEGRLRVYKQALNGREITLYHVAPGDACIVSAGCLLGKSPYNAAGLAKKDTLMVMLDTSVFNRLMTSEVFREFVFSLVSKRILELMVLVEEVAFQKLDRRLAALLVDRGDLAKISHQEIADELGTVREMVTRLLNSFSDDGWIRIGRGWVEVLDKAALVEMGRQ